MNAIEHATPIEYDVKIDLDSGGPVTTPEPTTPTVTAGLLAVVLNLHEGPTSKMDKQLSRDARQKTNASSDRVRTYKTTLSHPYISALRNAQKRLRKEVESWTTATGQDGVRILKVTNYHQFLAKYNAVADQVNEVRNLLAAEYDGIVAKQVEPLQGAYDASDYLTQEEFIGKWGYELRVTPVVQPSQISGLAEDIIDRVKESYEATIAAARKDVWARMVSVTGILAKSLQKNDRLHQSQWDALHEFIENAPDLLPEPDEQLEAHIEQLREFLATHPRDVANTSAEAQSAASESISERLAALKSQFNVM